MFRKKTFFIGILIALFFISFYFVYKTIFFNYFEKFNIFHIFELKTLDLRYYIRGNIKKDFDVIIVGIDEKSLNIYGKWPWKRSLHAELITKLRENGVKSIGFDIAFVERGVPSEIEKYKEKLKAKLLDIYKKNKIDKESALEIANVINEYNTSEDIIFAKAIKEAGNVVIGTYNFLNETDGKLSEEQKNNTTYFKSKYINFDELFIQNVIEKETIGSNLFFKPYSVYKIIPPIEIIGTFCYGVGPFDIGKPDPDGIFRNLPIITEERYSKGYYPPLSLLVFLRANNFSMEKNILYETDKKRVSIYKDVSLKKNKILSIPVDKNGIFNINYYGKNPFKYYSYVDIMENKIPKKELENKIVLIGFDSSAKALYDLRAIPFNPNAAGVEIHANAIQNFIDNKFLITVPFFYNWVLLLVFMVSIVIFMSLKKFSFKNANIIILLIISFYCIISIALFNIGYWVEMFYPIVSFIILYIFLILINYFDEEIEKIRLKQTFQHYMPPALIEELLKNPEKLKLGGERQFLTCFFSDIEGFTSLAETMNPEELVEFLNEYLTEMSEIIFKYLGTVDKYEGDAIMAIFGSPVAIDNHALKACFAAIECQEKLIELRNKWINEGKKPLYVRIGINTGEMIVGNMGSAKKFDFTVIGDEVNLASRLESANKEYGTYIMISQNTYEIVKDFVETRFLDVIRVKGKVKPVAVYELISRKGEISENKRKCLEKYMLGIEKYRNKEWNKAIIFFEEALAINPEDMPCKIYLKRCKNFIENPPSENWDGVYIFNTK